MTNYSQLTGIKKQSRDHFVTSKMKNPLIHLFNLLSDFKKTYSNVINNFTNFGFYLFILYSYPLITLPYLYRVFGVGQMGVIIFAQSIIQLFIIITDYGFDLTGTKAISINRTNQLQLNEIASVILIIKAILLLLCFIALLLLIGVSFNIRNNYPIYLLTFLLAIGQAIFPVWFYQGIEKLQYLTITNTIIKIIGIFLIFFLIKQPNDLYLYLLINGSVHLFIGIAGYSIMCLKFKIRFQRPTLPLIKKYLKEGKDVFLTNILSHAYISLNVIILGIISNPVLVGYYAIVEKAYFVFRWIAVIFFRSIYPHICNLAKKGVLTTQGYFNKIMPPLTIVFTGLCLLLFLLAPQIVLLFSGTSSNTPIQLLRMVSIAPLIVFLNTPPYQQLLVFGYEKKLLVIILYAAILSICSNILLSYYFGPTGTVGSILFSETFITVSLYILFNRIKKTFKTI